MAVLTEESFQHRERPPDSAGVFGRSYVHAQSMYALEFVYDFVLYKERIATCTHPNASGGGFGQDNSSPCLGTDVVKRRVVCTELAYKRSGGGRTECMMGSNEIVARRDR